MFCLKIIGAAALAVFLTDAGAPTKTASPKAATPPTKTPTAKPSPAKAAATKPASFKLHAVEEKVIQQTNAERARHGLPPLAVDQRLVQSARAHTAWMTRARRLQHNSRAMAENIAMGQPTALEAVRSWMSSSGHRANILNRSYRRIGVSGYTAPDGTVYWTQQFEP
jgi:uncharacterized protein YkwD